MHCLCRPTFVAAAPRKALLSSPAFRSVPRRGFVSNLFGGPQQLTATRTIRAPAGLVYDVISDVASYQHFVPYCQASVVTKESAPSAIDGRKYPEEAKLVVGFNNNVSESFWSRIYCVPGRVVEAIGGSTDTSLRGDAIAHHSARPAPAADPTRQDNVLSELSTRWTLRPSPHKRLPTAVIDSKATQSTKDDIGDVPCEHETEVNLHITYQFANPVYAALSQAAAPMVADKMIDAFETRVREVMGRPGNTRSQTTVKQGENA